MELTDELIKEAVAVLVGEPDIPSIYYDVIIENLLVD